MDSFRNGYFQIVEVYFCLLKTLGEARITCQDFIVDTDEGCAFLRRSRKADFLGAPRLPRGT
ncbi:hypothetical protein FM101_00570 [Arthrobacter rhombi]|uniref:Uncharacterized protein n=1 Tax=Arthrobacter rhombi TaxID=71253 RepID=A0A1R4ESL9_9MICC|nr:hypothetical protein FM101_00570 [Arthrobacter rhombi]